MGGSLEAAVAAVIRARCRARGLTYGALAEALGRDTSTVTRYLLPDRAAGRRIPLDLLPGIARALGTTAHELIREAEEAL